MNNKIHMLALSLLSVNVLLCADALQREGENYSSKILKKEKSIQIPKKFETCTFTPPKDWTASDPNALPKQVKILVKGNGQHEVPPSLNLATEKTAMDIKTYLKTIKELHESSGETTWSKLGSIQTTAGPATLTQIDTKTSWGNIRMMQAIIIHNKVAYILTATALKDEFPHFYKEFFQSIQSLKIDDGLLVELNDKLRKEKLEKDFSRLKKKWIASFEKNAKENSALSQESLAKKTFETNEFQKKCWIPFKNFISDDFTDMSLEWREEIIENMKEELLWTR